MPEKELNIVQVAVPTPLRRKFDYLLSDAINPEHVLPGMRVVVPFGRTRQIAVVLAKSSETDIDKKKLRAISKILDKKPILPESIIKLLNWVASYYHHPIGEVYQAALPVHYRKKESALEPQVTLWFLTETGRKADWNLLQRAVRQHSILEQLKNAPDGLTKEQIASEQEGQWQAALKALYEKKWLDSRVKETVITQYKANAEISKNRGLLLNTEQQAAVEALIQNEDCYSASLIDGITGSGKTEVYLAFIERQLKNTRQVLVLVPEIGLTPQLIHRFEQRFSVNIETLHSGLNNTQRMKIWQQAASGEIRILIGTRSAVFTPMPELGAIIIDEEHDLSFKQQDGIRYSAKDIALVRANNASIPIILGSATPSMESLFLCQQAHGEKKKMAHLTLRQRAGNARPPVVHLIDVRGQYLQHGMSRTLIDLIKQHLARENQVLLFQNRRGYSPVLLCNKCGWISHCHRCDAKLTYHRQRNHLRCHHCQTEQPLPSQCPECGHADLSQLGMGTERVEKVVREIFPETEVIRIDRDTTQRKGALQNMLELARNGKQQILIGTQMLAKGHHFPNVTLVAILDIDQGLYSIDFRAPERLAQLIVQVSGRAGREEKKGQVVLQTAHPEDEMLNTLLNNGYAGFAAKALAERKELLLPPYVYQALIRAEANKIENYQAFLEYCFQVMASIKQLWSKESITADSDIQFLGPVPAPMEKKAGKFRGQLLVQASHRKELHHILNDLIRTVEANKAAQRVRWSIDIDPQELY